MSVNGEDAAHGILIALWQQGTVQFTQEEQPAGQRRHITAGNPTVRTITKGHPKAHALPLHAAAKRSIGAADDPVSLEKQSRADRVGPGRDERRPALETGNGVLLDGERMQFGAQAIILTLPFCLGRELLREVRLPEGTVKDASDPEYEMHRGPCLPEFRNPLRISR